MLDNKRRYVVGKGLSAMAFAFYNPDCILITSGEKMNSPFVYIQENEYNRRFINDIGINADTETVRILPLANLSATIQGKGIVQNITYTGTERIANVCRDMVVPVISVTESEVCSRIKSILVEKNRVIEGEVVKITNSCLYLNLSGSLEPLPYSELIYSEHFKKFHKAMPSWDPGGAIKLYDLIYLEEEYDESLGGEMRYYDTADCIKKSNNAVNKTAGSELRPSAENLPPNAKIIKDARFSGQLAPPPQKVLFIGRSATANPHWKIEDSVFVAQEGYGLCKMLYEQQRFDYHLQRITGITGHERISGLILHMHSELGELLREIEWKMNVNSLNKPIKATSILEEGIDVIKLVMAIFYHFQYTPREINEMFWSKSTKVWEKTLNEFYGGA